MESKNRLLIAFSITALILVAIFTSFGRNLFNLNTPSVTLPTFTDSTHNVTDDGIHGNFQRVEVTPKTVQNVIASLQQPTSYYRQVSTTLYWEEGASSTTAEIWHHQGVSHVKKYLPNGLVRHDIMDSTHTYFWYDGQDSHLIAPLTHNSLDLSQQIPTYQTILSLPQDDIIQANYQYKEGVSCIFVKVVTAPLFYTQHYWVQVTNGFLVAAETYDQDVLLYKMEGFSPVVTPVPSTATFTLPNGDTIAPNNPEDAALGDL